MESSPGETLGESSGVPARGAGGLNGERADRLGVQPLAQSLQAAPVRL